MVLTADCLGVDGGVVMAVHVPALDQLRACGFVALHGLFSPAAIAALATSYSALPVLAEAPLLNGRREHLLPYQPPFSRLEWLLHHPVVASMAAHYFHEEQVELDALTVVLAAADGRRQPLHRDVLEGPEATLTLQVPLLDLPAVGSGALALQPGSHRGITDECDEGAPIHVGSLALGSALLYDARTCHFGTARTRGADGRPILYVLLRRRRTQRTGYEPFELRLRFGAEGLAAVARHRAAFRRVRDASANLRYDGANSSSLLAAELAACTSGDRAGARGWAKASQAWAGEHAGEHAGELTADEAVLDTGVPLVDGRPWYLR